MKRWFVRIVVCLLLGVVTTVGVAWVMPIVTNDWRTSARLLASPFGGMQIVDVSATASSYEWKKEAMGGKETLEIGVPFIALRMTSDYERTSLLDASATKLRVQARSPVFPGFIFNTLFYGVIWFGVTAAFGGVRMTIRQNARRKRGMCIKCGYDFRGSRRPELGCPECGWGREALESG